MVKTKLEIEEMLKRADRLNRLDSYVAELINSNPYETVTSQIFDINGVLSSSYIRVLDRGTVYNTASGQVLPLPSNSTTCVYKDVVRNILYVGTSAAGVWEYNLTTKVGKVYNTTGGATSGQQIQSNVIRAISKDDTMNMLYVATDSGIWYLSAAGAGGRITTLTALLGDSLPSNNLSSIIAVHSGLNSNLYVGTDAGFWTYNGTTTTGKLYNMAGGAGAGQQLPEDTVTSVYNDSVNGIVYVGTRGGVWELTGITGKVYDTAGGASFGLQLPDNWVTSVFKDVIHDILYVGTITAGIWRYNVATDFGYVTNTSSVVSSGSKLQSNVVFSVYMDTTNHMLYAGTDSGVWELNVTTYVGKIYNVLGGASQGSQLPNNTIAKITKDETRNVLYVPTNNGLWQYAYLSNINYNGTQTRTIPYSQFVTDILNEPIMIDHIRLMCSDASQFDKPIKLYYSTPNGKVESKYYSTMINRMATDGDQTVLDINLPKPIAFGSENYFALDILPSTTIFFTVFYRQVNKWELLNNIIGFRDNQFDSENSKNL